MSARTLVLPTVLGLALMACGGGDETAAPVLPLAHPITRDSATPPPVSTSLRGPRRSSVAHV